MGWLRATRYVIHRMLRLSDTTERICRGLSTGVAVSFTPLLGTHFIQAALFGIAVRGNIMASFIGTLVGNPWTLPIMWLFSYTLGVKTFSLFGFSDFATLPDHVTLAILWDMICSEPLRLFLPWIVGGYMAGILTWPIFFVIFYVLVSAAKRAQATAKAKRLKEQNIRRHKLGHAAGPSS